jgi:hypothetical protein
MMLMMRLMMRLMLTGDDRMRTGRVRTGQDRTGQDRTVLMLMLMLTG